MVFGSLLVHPGPVFLSVFGDDNGKIACGKKKRLVTE